MEKKRHDKNKRKTRRWRRKALKEYGKEITKTLKLYEHPVYSFSKSVYSQPLDFKK